MDSPLSVDRLAAGGTVKHIVSWSGGKDSSAMRKECRLMTLFLST